MRVKRPTFETTVICCSTLSRYDIWCLCIDIGGKDETTYIALVYTNKGLFGWKGLTHLVTTPQRSERERERERERDISFTCPSDSTWCDPLPHYFLTHTKPHTACSPWLGGRVCLAPVCCGDVTRFTWSTRRDGIVRRCEAALWQKKWWKLHFPSFLLSFPSSSLSSSHPLRSSPLLSIINTRLECIHVYITRKEKERNLKYRNRKEKRRKDKKEETENR